MKCRPFAMMVSLVGLLLMTACHPEPKVVDLVQNMAVQTNYDNTVNFSTYTTYAMPLDSLGQVYNADATDTLITGDYAKLITAAIRTNLDTRGYTRVTAEQNPDLAVNAFVVRDFAVFQSVTYPGYYGGYSGYYYPSYYGYGGYYGYPYVNTYASESGTLVIELVDLKNRDSQNKVRVVWTAYIGDILSSVDTYKKSKEAVDQAFTQSPYLHK